MKFPFHRLLWLVPTFLLLTGCGGRGPSSRSDEDHAAESEGHDGDDQGKAHAGEVHVDPEVAEQQGIRVVTAERRFLPATLTVPARVALSQEAHARLVSPVEGRIAEFITPIGAEVAAGDPIAVLHSPEFAAGQREFVFATRAVAAALPVETLTRDAWQRAADLSAGLGDPPLAEVQRRETEFRRAEAERVDAEGRVQRQRDVLALWGLQPEAIEGLLAGGQPAELFLLRAPMAGRVIERSRAIGDFVGPEDGPVATIADLSRLWVLANYPESRLRALRVGASAQVLLESEPGHGCPGRVVFISPVLDLANRTVEVRIVPDDRHEDLRPGLFARAEIELGSEDGAPAETVVVPESAVVRLDGTDAVFVPVDGEPGVYVQRRVRTGRAVRGWIPLFEGLEVGERYVSEGAFLLKAEFEKSEGGHDH